MQFSKFDTRPTSEDMSVTEDSISLMDLKKMISIGVIDRYIFSPGCNVDTLCLGEGSLGLEINNRMIYSPGEYELANNGGRVVMHITYMVRAFESGMILTTILPQRDVYSQVVYKILQWTCC